MRDGSGIALNFVSQSRSILVFAAVNPRMESPSAGIDGRAASKTAGRASERRTCDMVSKLAGNTRGRDVDGRAGPLKLHLRQGPTMSVDTIREIVSRLHGSAASLAAIGAALDSKVNQTSV